MQTITKPQVLSEPFAEEGIKNTIPVNPTGTYLASLKEGFPAITMTPIAQGGQPPEGADFNGLLNLDSQFYFAFQNGYFPTFEDDVSDAIGGYPLGARLFYTDSQGRGMLLRSLQGNNTYNFNDDSSYIGQYWAIDLAAFGTGKNLGEIFTTLRTDNNFTGAVECNGATYNVVDFPDFAPLLTVGNIPVCTLAEFANSVTTNGVCAKFGFDSGGATFRVPLINNVFVEAGTGSALGTYIPAGLPNITGTYGNRGREAFASGCFYLGNPIGMSNRDEDGTTNAKPGIFDASRSSSIYGNSTTVQPKAVKLRYMVQLANGIVDSAFATCTAVTADVADLKDLSNLTTTGKAKAAHLAMPSTTITTITPAPASGGTLLAPADGYFVARAAAPAAGRYLELNGGGMDSLVHSGAGSLDLSIFIPVQKGTSVTTYYSTNTPTFKFVYANGAV